MASKKKATKKKAGKRGGMNKSAFVRSIPMDTPAAEVVQKAKAAGMTLNEKYVYNIRAAARAKAGKPAAAKRGRPKGSVNKPTASSGSAETRLAELVLELGLTRSEELFRTIRERVRRAAVG